MYIDDKYPAIVYLNAAAHYLIRANDSFYKYYINNNVKDARVLELSCKLNDLALLISSFKE